MNFSTLLSFRIRPKPKRWQQCPGCNNWRVLLMLRGGVVVWCDDLVTVRWVPSTGSSYSCPTTPTYPTVALQPDKQHTPTHLPPACLADQISLLTFSSLLARIYVNGTLCQTLETREDEVSWKSNLQIWRLSLFAEKEKQLKSETKQKRV